MDEQKAPTRPLVMADLVPFFRTEGEYPYPRPNGMPRRVGEATIMDLVAGNTPWDQMLIATTLERPAK